MPKTNSVAIGANNDSGSICLGASAQERKVERINARGPITDSEILSQLKDVQIALRRISNSIAIGANNDMGSICLGANAHERKVERINAGAPITDSEIFSQLNDVQNALRRISNSIAIGASNL